MNLLASNGVPLPDAEPACHFKSLSSWKSLTADFTGVTTYAHNSSRDQRRQQKEFGQAAMVWFFFFGKALNVSLQVGVCDCG